MLSIIIVHHRTPEILRLCLKNLKETLKKEQQDTEVIVVDSNADSETKEIMESEFAEFYYLPYKTNLGYAKGVNLGIKHSKGEFLFVTQPDVIVTPESLKKMTEYLNANPSIGLLGPKLLNFDNTIQQSYFRFPSPFTILYRRTFIKNLPFAKKGLSNFEYSDTELNSLGKNSSKIITVDWLMGAALMTTRKAINKVGGMDERFFMYFEDVDWARRFWQKNYSVVYFPEVSMYHWLMRASRSSFGILDPIFNKQTRIHIKSAIYYFFKWKQLKYSNHKI